MSTPDGGRTAAAGPARPWPPETLDEQLDAIDLATQFFRLPGALHAEVFNRYRINGTRFWQTVNVLLDLPDIIEKRPRERRRLDEQRSLRRAVRDKVRANLGKDQSCPRP